MGAESASPADGELLLPRPRPVHLLAVFVVGVGAWLLWPGLPEEPWVVAARGRLAEADRALAVDGNDLEARRARAEALADLGEHETILAELDEVLRADPSAAWAHHEKARVLARIDRSGDALEAARVALDLEPTAARHHSLLARLYYDQALVQQSLEAAERALALDDRDCEGWEYRGLALAELERHEEAVGAFDEVILRRPSLASVHFYRGNSLWELARWREAEGAYLRALEIDPEHAGAAHNLEAVGQRLEAMGLVRDVVDGIEQFAGEWRSRG
jgi:tetratricopeptide (TPR) repeat protein